jgi:hypothetical protein
MPRPHGKKAPSEPQTGPKPTPENEPASAKKPTPIPKTTLEAAGCKTEAEFKGHYRALFEGWNCSITPRELLGTGQVMQVAVFIPDQPLPSSRGPLRALWFGHVAPDVKTGRVEKGDTFARSFDSGIRFENNGVPLARAAHIHACASTTGQLTPNGDVDGLACAEVMGWTPVTFLGNGGPGPSQYQGGAYTAGRHRSDFTNTGHQIPDMPG